MTDFGDLDALLARAGEIKQPKRRETLTDPEQACTDPRVASSSSRWCATCRSGRRCTAWACTSPSPTQLVPLPEGHGVHHAHAPRRRGLPAAMRPTSSPIPNSSARAAGAAATATTRRATSRSRAGPTRRPSGTPAAGARAGSRPAAPGSPARSAAGRGAGRRRGSPPSSPTRPLLGRSPRSTRSTPCSRRPDDGGPGGRHRDHLARSPQRGASIGIALATAPGEACYVPLGHRGGRAVAACSATARCCPASSTRDAALERLQPVLRSRAVLKIAQNMKYDLARLRRSRHRAAHLRRHDAARLCARLGQEQPGRARARRAGQAPPQPHADRLQGSCGLGQELHRLRARRRSTRPPNMRPRTPT